MNSSNSPNDVPLIYAVRLREHAYRDINAAHVHYAEAISAERANEWRENLLNAIAGLATFPRRCPIAPDNFRQEVRQLQFQRSGSRYSYRILFMIINEQPEAQDPPTVIIIHIRHNSRRALTRREIREIEAGD